MGARAAATAAGPAALAVHCFGPFQLLVGGNPIDIWRSARARALFQYLVSHRAHPVTRNAVLEALWPDPEATPASTSLKVVVHRLRKALGTVDADGPIDIQAGEDGYQLSAVGMWVDIEQFDRSLSRARQLEGAGQAAAAILEYSCAADLYHGDFLLDVGDEWAVLRRERLKDQYLHSLERLTDAALAAGDYDGCIDRCQLILEHDHCREDAYRALMVSHARLGQRGRSRRWYEVCVESLRTNLDVDPEPETQLTYRRAVAGEFSQHNPTALRETAS
ncbi:MAG TPA: BTAD domain-containing putative transcriptional regulator [Chloroflexota bacterium]|nr:BTAD domain-containing putative transcriptional regulator [Chloroflexota bacterium]